MSAISIKEIRDKLNGATIYIIPYTHPDWSWCHTRQWHELRYISVFEELLALLEKNDSTAWYMDCYITELAPLLERKPELTEKLRDAVSSGRVSVCGGFSNVRPNMVADEAYIRNLIIGRKKFLNIFPEADLSVHADSVDVAIGHPQLPQLLKKAGYSCFRAGRPYGVMQKKGIPHGFFWEGLDKSTVLCWWAEYDAMNSRKTAELLNKETDWEQTVCELYESELRKFSDNSPVDMIWLPQASDDGLPFKVFNSDIDIDVFGLAERWNYSETSAMKISTPPVFFRELIKRREDIAVVSGTIDPCDVCYNVAWGGERGLAPLRIRCAEMIADAEKWMAFSAMLGTGLYSETDELWESNLTASAHASQWVFEEDIGELFGFALRSLDKAAELREKAMRKITEALTLPENTAAVVFNSNDKAEEAVVPLTVACGSTEGLELCGGNGEKIDFQVLEPLEYSGSAWENRLLVKTELAPNGVNIVHVKKGDVSCRKGETFIRPKKPMRISSEIPFVMSNELIKLSFCGGNLDNIADIESGCTLTSEGVFWNTLEFTSIDTDKGGLHAGPVTGRSRIVWQDYVIAENGPLRWKCSLTGSDGKTSYTQEIVIEAGSRVIRFETRTSDFPVCAGHLSAKIPVGENARIFGGIPFGSETKDIDNEPYNEREEGWSDFHRQWDGLFFAKDFAAVRDERTTLALCHLSGDRYYMYDKKEKSLSCLLINTAYPYKDTCEEYMNTEIFQSPGAHTFCHALIIEPANTPDSKIINRAYSLRNRPVTLRPYRSMSSNPCIPPLSSFAFTDAKNVVLSAVYFEGKDLIARLWESDGKATDACLTVCSDVSGVQAEDFIGTEDKGVFVKAENNRIKFSLKPHEIITLRIRLKKTQTERTKICQTTMPIIN